MNPVKVVAIVLLLLGGALGIYGAVIVFSNGPLNEQSALSAKQNEMAGRHDFVGNRMDQSLFGAVEMMEARSSIRDINAARDANRSGAMPFLIVGVIMAAAGGVLLVKGPGQGRA